MYFTANNFVTRGGGSSTTHNYYRVLQFFFFVKHDTPCISDTDPKVKLGYGAKSFFIPRSANL